MSAEHVWNIAFAELLTLSNTFLFRVFKIVHKAAIIRVFATFGGQGDQGVRVKFQSCSTTWISEVSTPVVVQKL